MPKNLTHLDVANSSGVEDKFFHELSCSNITSQLKVLKLKDTSVTLSLEHYIHRFENLESLDIRLLRVEEFSFLKALPQLKKLKIFAGDFDFSEMVPKLESLTCNTIFPGFWKSANTPMLKRLVSLEISYVNENPTFLDLPEMNKLEKLFLGESDNTLVTFHLFSSLFSYPFWQSGFHLRK